MSFYVSHRYGGDHRDVAPAAIVALLAEVETAVEDPEHPNISVVHDEAGWVPRRPG